MRQTSGRDEGQDLQRLILPPELLLQGARTPGSAFSKEQTLHGAGEELSALKWASHFRRSWMVPFFRIEWASMVLTELLSWSAM